MSELVEADKLREEALQACWDEYSELMPDALYKQVKEALGLRIFEATLVKHEHRYPKINGQGFPELQCLDCGHWRDFE